MLHTDFILFSLRFNAPCVRFACKTHQRRLREYHFLKRKFNGDVNGCGI